jgi:ferredoxin
VFTVGLEQIAKIMTGLESKTIRVYPRQCSRVRHRRSTCTRCADACPSQAITWQDSLKVESDNSLFA